MIEFTLVFGKYVLNVLRKHYITWNCLGLQ